MPKLRSAAPTLGRLAGVVVVLWACQAMAEESVEPEYLSNVRQVTSGFAKAGEGYFSPDAKTIIYQAVEPRYPFYQIFTQPVAGGTPRMVSTGRGRTTCAYFAPDRPKILFASSHLDPKRSEERRVGKECRSRWSPDH